MVLLPGVSAECVDYHYADLSVQIQRRITTHHAPSAHRERSETITRTKPSTKNTYPLAHLAFHHATNPKGPLP